MLAAVREERETTIAALVRLLSSTCICVDALFALTAAAFLLCARRLQTAKIDKLKRKRRDAEQREQSLRDSVG